MNLRDILRTASSNLWRSKVRTLLTIIAIFIGALTLSLTNGIGSGISSYINKELGNLGATDALIVTPASTSNPMSGAPQTYDPDRTTISSGGRGADIAVLTPADLTKISKTAGVVKVETTHDITADYIAAGTSNKYQVSVSEYLTGTNLDMATGKRPSNTDSELEISLPLQYVSPLGFKSSQAAVGKTVTIGITSATGVQQMITATVSGVQQASLIGGGAGEINVALINALYTVQSQGLPLAVTQQYPEVIARFDPSSSTAQITDLKNRLKDQGYDAATIKDEIGTVENVINGVILALDAFGIIALLAASFGIINTLLMAVQERTKEIGLMKAMGMGRGKIFLLFSTEAVLLGFWGSLLGSLAANGIGRVVNNYASNGVLKDLVGLQLLSFPAKSVAEIMGLIMLIAFLAGTLPARRAAKQSPIDALRYE